MGNEKVDWEEVEQELALLVQRRNENGTNADLAKRIHALQKRLAYHRTHPRKETPWDKTPLRVYGKRLKDMTVEERRAYALYRYYAAKGRKYGDG